jgi:hypothetical protein
MHNQPVPGFIPGPPSKGTKEIVDTTKFSMKICRILFMCIDAASIKALKKIHIIIKLVGVLTSTKLSMKIRRIDIISILMI